VEVKSLAEFLEQAANAVAGDGMEEEFHDLPPSIGVTGSAVTLSVPPLHAMGADED
jgi:hypothetical protein